MREQKPNTSDQFFENNDGFGDYLSSLKEMKQHDSETCTCEGHITVFIPGTDQMICGVGGFSSPEEEGGAWRGYITTRGGAHLKGEVAHIGGRSPEEYIQDTRRI